MKRHWNKKSVYLSVLSGLALIIFAILAIGSGDIEEFIEFPFDRTVELQSDDGHTVSISFGYETLYIQEGHKDEYGRWNGRVLSEGYSMATGLLAWDNSLIYRKGYRNGIAYTKYYNSSGEITHRRYMRYQNGRCVSYGSKIAYNTKSTQNQNSAYDFFSGYFPEDVLILGLLGYDTLYQERFLDTLELVLNATAFEFDDFEDHYEEAIEALEASPYDSIISDNEALSFMNGFEIIKHHPFRLGVIDRYLEEKEGSFDVLQSRYPGFIKNLEEAEISEPDFHEFCRQFDSSMYSYGNLDLDLPFLVDSIDVRIYRALMSLYDTGEDDEDAVLKSLAIRTMTGQMDFRASSRALRSKLQSAMEASDPPEVAEVILYTIFMSFFEGDLIKKSVWESFIRDKEIIMIPDVGTGELTGLSGTSVSLDGYIFYNGGAAIIDKGVVWGEIHDPTTDMNSIGSGIEADSFEVVINGLEEGKRYYARAYATNSEGTAYGSSISFVVSPTTGVEKAESLTGKLEIFPNPASGKTTIEFILEFPDLISLNILNLKGQLVRQDEIGFLAAGLHHLEIDLLDMEEGVYFCQLSVNGSVSYIQKLVVIR